ncbi:putative RND superfamily exporter protein [Aquimarina sp. EL_43]|uniref:efflux RND transporter permease subunit n=1 Tax=Aquimarina TaxID=290174 RepID=UPI00046EBC2B|nr:MULTISPECIES: MMPL family transporter [Aquimarina]MBG6133703.1 putative RND superfamily exporter protein [Aquimarina sp. EL_35]MBG6153876.1 putative RND superfamily exporter protein [Aquimarina sp. EL_32]MBG6172076.1 putative RND superfamily exporter protein [Aquimarina sp. EL_43]
MSKNPKSKTNFFENVTQMVRKKRLIIWLAFVAITIFTFLGIPKTKFDMTIEGWFPENDEVLVAMDKFKAEFGSNEGVYIAYKPLDGDVFSTKSLEVVKKIREDILHTKYNKDSTALKHIVKVNTLVNASLLTAEGDVLVSRKLVGDNVPTKQEDIEEIRKLAQSQKSFPLLFFSKDMKYGGILIETDFGTELLEEELPIVTDEELVEDALEMDEMVIADMSEIKKNEERIRFKRADLSELVPLMEEINTILDKPEYKSHLEYYAVGNAPLAYEQQAIAIKEAGPIYLGLLLIISILLWFFIRSFSAVAWSLLIVIISAAWTVGLAGWLEVEVTVFLMLTIMLILTVGVCDAAHIFSGYVYFRNQGNDRKIAIQKVFASTNKAIVLTAFTNIIGMLACFLIPIPRIQVFGIMSAAGVAFACILTIFFLPLLLDVWAPGRENTQRKKKFRLSTGKYLPNFSMFLQKKLNSVPSIVQKNPIGIIVLFLLVLGINIYGVTVLKIDTNIANQFVEGSPYRESADIIDEKMMGSLNMEIYLDLSKANAFENPFVLNTIDKLQRKLETKYNDVVVRTSSLVEVVKKANKTLNEEKEEMYTIPDNQNALSQTLFLFNLANPEDRRKQVSDNYSKSHISVQLYNVGSLKYLKVYEGMQKDIDEAVTMLKQQYPDTKVSITGALPMNMRFVQVIASNGLQDIIMVLIAVTIVLIFVFGSIQGGLIAIIPNLIPSMLTLGLLGLTGRSVDIDILLLLPVVVGISVDDTVHFISHYRDKLMIDGDIKKALYHTIKEVGQAVTFTSLILGLGFGILSFSAMEGTANVGKFGSIAIFSALMCDLFLLPALILVFKPKFQKKGKPKFQRKMVVQK